MKNEFTLKMIDLFSGIGGFSLAAEWCFGDKLEIVAFCEIDPFCQAILKKKWPNVPIIKDVKDAAAQLIQYKGKIDLLTGGFPCQPFSISGKRKGTEDNRYLWPNMLAIIKAVRPRWIVAENVAGIVRMALDTVLSDLESESYSTGAVIIPACAVNAPHRRDRVWIIAHSDDNGYHKQELRELQKISNDAELERSVSTEISGFESLAGRNWFTFDTFKQDWNYNWLEVAAKLCGVDNGLPARMDGLELSGIRHRKERIKALGNAIVPQIAYVIFKAIQQIEKAKKNDKV